MLKYTISLKSDQGKYVRIKNTRDGWKLVVEDAQNSEVQDLTLWSRKENKVAFVWKNKNTYYSPKVNGGELKLETFPDQGFPSNLSCHHWFEMRDHHRDFYGLVSVVEPGQHLSLSSTSKLIISADDTKWAYFKDENHQQVFATTG